MLALGVLGLSLLNEEALGFSAEGKILIKTLHVYVGYVFAVNLLWRLVWTFVGNEHARWRAITPFYSGFFADLRQHLGGTHSCLGHNPLGRLMVSLLLLLLTTQALTGLVLAGTDLYKPPLGGVMAQWVTAGDAEKLALLQPGSKEHVDEAAYAEMRAFRKPIVTTHGLVFYVLLVAVALHILGTIVAEVRDKNGLVSAMFSGQKVFRQPPEG